MASIVVAGDTSGTVTLAAPAVSGTTTLTLPTTSGTLITTGGGAAGSFTTLTSTQDASFATSSGSVGVGTSSPTGKIQANSTYATTWNTNDSTAAGYTPQSNELAIINNQNATTNSWAGIFFQGGQASTNTQLHTARIACLNDGTTYGGALAFATRDASTANSVERMRIDSSGRPLFNTTSALNAGYMSLLFDGSAYNGFTLKTSYATLGSVYLYFINSAGNVAGYVTQNGTTTVNYVTSSDYRMKENVVPITNALDRVAKLKPVTYTWKDTNNEQGEGFIAHELQEVCPLAVSGEKDAVNEDGTIKPQGIDTSKLVATLTAAIQELTARVKELEAKVK